ncbi:hypothetical protein BU826_004733 [Salmonella enterica subsp. enterica serovar Ohio]|nr:hypothetical protein [Salmonella enterica subsp. enterica serovar Ohio]
MLNKANLLFIAVIAIPFYSFSSTTTITNLHTMQLQQQISRNAAVNSGVTTNPIRNDRLCSLSNFMYNHFSASILFKGD